MEEAKCIIKTSMSMARFPQHDYWMIIALITQANGLHEPVLNETRSKEVSISTRNYIER